MLKGVSLTLYSGTVTTSPVAREVIDALTSVEVKADLFRQATDEDWTIVLSHEPRRPVGRLVADRDRVRFEPVV